MTLATTTRKPLVKIWHPWPSWECFKAGFYGPYPEGVNKASGEAKYGEFFRVPGLFEASLRRVLEEWPNSCEHNLTSASLNKIAWGGQAAACIAWGIPAECRAGYRLLTKEEQKAADEISERLIREWYDRRGYEQPETL